MINNNKTKKLKISISKGNTKLGKMVPNINLPPIVTCRKNAPCAKGCYARNGNYKYPSVIKSHINNLVCYINDPKKYFDDIILFLKKRPYYEYFRFHGSGDIIDEKYLKGMVRTAKECPEVHFLAFTKKFEIVNTYLKKGYRFPKNLKIVFSAWDKDFKVDNPFGKPITYVDFCKKERNPEMLGKLFKCPGHCETCKRCWTLRKNQAVVFHQH